MSLALSESTYKSFLNETRQRGDPNYVDQNGITALCYAIYNYRSLSLVEALVKNGADVNKYTTFSDTSNDTIVERDHTFSSYRRLGSNFPPLHIAVACGQANIVRLLLNCGADPNAKTSRGFGLLQIVLNKSILSELWIPTPSEKEQIEMLKLLIRHGLDISAKAGRPLLHYAIEYEQYNIAKYLISLNCGVNSVDKSTGQTALHLATALDCTRLLLENNANANAQDHSGKTPLHRDSLSVECTRLLLEHKGDPNIQDTQGQTPLHCSSKNFERTKLLLECNAKPNVQDSSGKTVYHYVMEKILEDQVNLIFLLHDYQVGPDIRDNQGKTAVFYMISSSLWEKNVGETILPVLAKLGHLDVAVATRDAKGEPFLHVLIKEASSYIRDISYFEYILSLVTSLPGADINIRDLQDATVLHFVSAEGNREAAKVLLKHGADIKATDYDGNTPLHVAIQRRQWDLAKNLLRWRQLEPNQQPPSSKQPDAKAIQRSKSLPNLSWTPRCYSVFERIFGLEERYHTFSKEKERRLCAPIQSYEKFLPSPSISKVFSPRIRSTSLLQTCEENSVGELHLFEECGEEKCMITKDVHRLVTDLVKKCEELDPRMKCNLLLTGSAAEQSKMWAPNEFDFLMELTELNGQCDLSHRLSLPNVILRKEQRSLWSDLLHTEEILPQCKISPGKLKDHMIGLLRKSSLDLDRRRYPRFHLTLCAYSREDDFIHKSKVGAKLTLYWTGEKYRKLLINVDLTPAIQILLLEQFRPELYERAIGVLEPHVHLIPCTETSDALNWRLSFTSAELKLIRSLSPKQLSLYKCLKFLRDIHVVNITEVPSYHLKCFVFDFVDNGGYNDHEDFTTNTCRALRQLCLYSDVYSPLARKGVQHFFFKKYSLYFWDLDMRWCVTALEFLNEA